MTQEDKFLSQVKSALDHLYDYRYLNDHPLARLYSPDNTAQADLRAERFNRLVLESIDKINPPEAPCNDTLRVRSYRLLVHKYVEEWPLQEIMRELGVSRTQFFREQQKAIAVLATVLRDEIPVDALMRSPEAQTPASAVSQSVNLGTEAERVLTHYEQIDPAQMIGELLRVLDNLAQQRKVELSYASTSQLPRIHGSRTLIRQVYLEALSTLIAMPGAQHVAVHLARSPEGVVSEVLVHTEAPETTKTGQINRASGDHLKAVHRLVEIAGGRWYGTEGTAFGAVCRFELPKAEPRVVLVIDDNEGMIRVFESYLESAGYQIVGCTTGTEALRLAKELEPAVITLDIMMPNQDGWEILLGLREEPTTTGAPIIICSVLDDPQLAFSLGADAYLAKPITQEDLLATLGELIH